MQAHKKCAITKKERNKEKTTQQKIFNGKKEDILVLRKTVVTHLDEHKER